MNNSYFSPQSTGLQIESQSPNNFSVNTSLYPDGNAS